MLLGREKQTSISRWGHWCLPLLFQYMGGWWLWRTLFRRWGRAGQIRRRRWSSRGSIAGRRGDPLQRSFLYSCLSCKPCSLIFLSYFGNFGMMQVDKQCQTSKNIRLSKRSWVARPLPLCLGMYKQNCFQLVSKCHRVITLLSHFQQKKLPDVSLCIRCMAYSLGKEGYNALIFRISHDAQRVQRSKRFFLEFLDIYNTKNIILSKKIMEWKSVGYYKHQKVTSTYHYQLKKTAIN